jgi:uncharacterized membrane protein
LLGRVFGRPSFRWAAFWSLIGALLIGAITAATGYWDFTHAALGDTSRCADFHLDVGFIPVAAIVVLRLWRWLVYARRDVSPGYLYLIAALLVMGLTLFQGWYGGEMVYSEREWRRQAKERNRQLSVNSFWIRSQRRATEGLRKSGLSNAEGVHEFQLR